MSEPVCTPDNPTCPKTRIHAGFIQGERDRREEPCLKTEKLKGCRRWFEWFFLLVVIILAVNGFRIRQTIRKCVETECTSQATEPLRFTVQCIQDCRNGLAR